MHQHSQDLDVVWIQREYLGQADDVEKHNVAIVNKNFKLKKRLSYCIVRYTSNENGENRPWERGVVMFFI